MHDLAERPAVVRGRILRVCWAYFALTKPRVMELLLVTTAPVMVLAQGGLPNGWLVLGTLFGGAMSGGSAAAFNMYFDRDIDAQMSRTSSRPIVTGEVSPRAALRFAWILALASTAFFAFAVNPLTAALSAFAIFFYVVVYTIVLKRRTAQNIVWGGIAGCFPVVIGWSAVTNALAWPAIVLFLLVFLWTPAHYWPLSVNYRDDYRAAKVPMLGATHTARQVSVQVAWYAFATVACSIALVPIGGMGVVYTSVTVVAGGWFAYESWRLWVRSARTDDIRLARPMRVFHSSITYLTVVFLAVAIDPLVRLGS